MPRHIGGWFAGLTAVALAVGMPAQSALGAEQAQGAGQQRGTQPQARSGNVVKDGWITVKIHSQFLPEDALDGSDIDVDTDAGVVTLSGTVVNDAGRARAVAIAKATDGVKSVNDKLKIAAAKPGVEWPKANEAGAKAGRAIADGWIKSKIYAQYLTDWSVFDDSDLDIDVASGVVTLNGSVATPAAKTRAVAIAKGTDGVKSVTDKLTVLAPKP
jgi:hyperosmotically inducible protein